MKDKKIKLISLTLLIASLIFISYCSPGKALSADQMHKMIQKDNPLIIDIRTPEKFKDGHINGAQNVEFHPETFLTEMDKLPRDRDLYLYCGKGLKTEKARDLVADLEFKNIYLLTGGITSWKKAGYPLVK